MEINSKIETEPKNTQKIKVKGGKITWSLMQYRKGPSNELPDSDLITKVA